jgi:hypothetical protein
MGTMHGFCAISHASAIRALAQLVIREIVYRLLTGAEGSRMRHLAIIGVTTTGRSGLSRS